MLGKLLKHEFKQSSRIILIILAILVVITPITALYTRFNMNRVPDTDLPFFDIFEALQGIAMVLYVCAMIAAAAATVILLMYRFYKSMVTSEGYLTHTLPAKTSSIVTSKLIVNIAWQLISFAVMFLSIIAFTLILGLWKLSDLSDINFSAFFRAMDYIGIKGSFFTLLIISVFVTLVRSILQYFVSFAIGHRMNGHPFLGFVITYIVISIILQIIGSVMGIVYSIYTSAVDTSVYMNTISSAINPLLIASIIQNIILGAIFYFVTVYMFKNKLNI